MMAALLHGVPISGLVLVLGVALGIGLTGVAAVLLARHVRTGPRISPEGTDGTSRPLPGNGRAGLDVPGLVLAAAVGAACAFATGWPAAGLIGALAASSGLGQAITATAELSPMPIRSATERLAAQIQAGIEPRVALLRFADDVGDPCADRVVCSLLLAFSSRAQRLGDLLSALAESTREEVGLRLRVETSRASVRSGVRTVVVFSVTFAAGLALLARSYLAPFDSATGQIVLMVVGGLYAAGLTLMVALARPPAAIRLLGKDVVER